MRGGAPVRARVCARARVRVRARAHAFVCVCPRVYSRVRRREVVLDLRPRRAYEGPRLI